MATLSQKLQIKPGQRLLVLYPPPGILEKIKEDLENCEVMIDSAGKMDAVLLYVTTLTEVPTRFTQAKNALKPGGLLWVAYIKSSAGIKTDVNRDRLDAAIQLSGWRGVRIVGLDDIWSALRFRPTELVGK